MNLKPVLLYTWLVCYAILGRLSTPAAAAEQWFVSLYAGRYSDTALNENMQFNTDFESSRVVVASLGKELGIYKEKIGVELEGQLGWHSGMQSHGEINTSFTLRWLPFFWDRYVDTSFAFGNGVSYATSDPELEIRKSNDKETNQWLYYILIETAFVVPRYKQWDVFVRIHHRSSVFGAINGISTGSNFVGVGVRYRIWGAM
jgi:hypothetical protein